MRAIALLLLVSTAHAYCPPAERPPTKFDHPYRGELFEYSLPIDRVDAACSKLRPSAQRTGGCGYEIVEHDPDDLQRIVRRYGIIVYPVGCKAVRRHEIGHTNGWRH